MDVGKLKFMFFYQTLDTNQLASPLPLHGMGQARPVAYPQVEA